MQERFSYKAPAAPGNSATIELWNSITALEGATLSSLGIDMLIVTFVGLNQASAADGLKAYANSDGVDVSASWTQISLGGVYPKTVPAVTAPGENRYKFTIENLDHFKVEYTAGATGPSTWNVKVVGLANAASMST